MTSSNLPTQAPRFRLAVLVLAAGEGSRLGSYPKALLCKDGLSLIKHLSHAIQAFNPLECLVVTGFHAEAIEFELAKIKTTVTYPIKIVRNITPEKGQASSVRLGLESCVGEFDALLVVLSDQPQVGMKEVQELLEEYVQRQKGEEVILPMVGGQRGNPVLFSKKAVLDTLATPGMVCRTYMDKNPQCVRMMETHNQAFIMDVDTQEDIKTHRLSMR
jgi:CTP:molybdopterin cytidylyltransferase MocA